jgi:hypothetical protein
MKCDNTGAIQMADHMTDHGRTKHIAIRHFFIREHTENNDIKTVYVPTENQLADILTKATTKQIFIRMRDQLLIRANCKP